MIHIKTMKEIPILLYRNIGDYPEDMMEDGILPRSFERQMSFLSENGYRVVMLSQAVDHLNCIIKLHPKSLAITIDGGYKDAFSNVLPVLKRHDFHATFLSCPSISARKGQSKANPLSA